MATGSRRAKSVPIHADPNPDPEHYLLTEMLNFFILKFRLCVIAFFTVTYCTFLIFGH